MFRNEVKRISRSQPIVDDPSNVGKEWKQGYSSLSSDKLFNAYTEWRNQQQKSMVNSAVEEGGEEEDVEMDDA